MENRQEYTERLPQGEVDKVISVKKWMLTLLVMMIPLVNIVCLIVWALSDSENKNRSNWAKAQLLMMLLSMVLVTIFFIIFGMTLFGLSNS